ncbi:MAG: UbiA family prenyltransferase [Acidobacteria bacterium]|nr:UbiA family prenyltransferase [Acidobacteriota bacterium]
MPRHAGRSALRLLHYVWPLALGWSASVVVHRATGRAPSAPGLVTLLSGILAAYTLDRVFEPGVSRALRGVLAVIGTAAAVLCGLAAWRLPVETSAIVPVLAVASLFYARLKRLVLTKTFALPLIWTWACLALPFNDGTWLGWRALAIPVALPLFLLISAGCLLCDLKDETRDREAGVQSVPAMFGRSATVRIAIVLVLLAGGAAVAEERPGLLVSALALGLATTSPALLATDAAGPLLVDAILTLPGILIAARLV